MTEPYWEDRKRGLKVILADCRDVLPEFAHGEFGSVITDPPYGIGFADWDIPPDSAILQECLRVAEGTVLMFGGAASCSMAHFSALSPERILAWAPARAPGSMGKGAIWQNWAPVYVWRVGKKQDAIRSDVLRHDMFIPGGVRERGIFRHPCSKPDCLMEDILKAFGGPSTLDPYMGSGTTLVAAAKLGIPCTGIEISEKYCEMAVCRLEGGFMDDEPAHLFNLEREDGG